MGNKHSTKASNKATTTDTLPAGLNAPTVSGNVSPSAAESSTEADKQHTKHRRRETLTPSMDVREKYRVDHAEIGHGHYGVVRKCQNRYTKEFFAIKTIRKAKVGRLEVLKREIDILRKMDHPNIIRLIDVYEDEKYLHLVTELCTGGELFDRIIAKTKSAEGHYSERDAAKIVKCILGAISYVHNVHNISHRDLKPENFIFETPADDSRLKIIDFGLSRYDDEVQHMTTKVGTPYYIAPEVLTRRYDKECDLWSIGVITYVLLCGYPPFYGETDAEIFTAVKSGRFEFRSPEWDCISDEAKDLIRQLLQKDPMQRLTADEALDHPWITKHDEPADQDKSINSIKRTLTTFVQMNKLKEAAQQLLAEELSQEDLRVLGRNFRRLDSNHDGRLTVNQMKSALHDMGYDVSDQIINIVGQIETDNDSKLSYVEIIDEAMQINEGIAEDNIRRVFKYLDRGQIGAISCGGIIDALGDEDDAVEVAAQFDLTGQIGFQEFRRVLQRLDQDSESYKKILNIGLAPNEGEETMSPKESSAVVQQDCSPPLPPPEDEDTPAAHHEDGGNDPSSSGKIKFHRPSIIKALFPKDKDKKKEDDA